MAWAVRGYCLRVPGDGEVLMSNGNQIILSILMYSRINHLIEVEIDV